MAADMATAAHRGGRGHRGRALAAARFTDDRQGLAGRGGWRTEQRPSPRHVVGDVTLGPRHGEDRAGGGMHHRWSLGLKASLRAFSDEVDAEHRNQDPAGRDRRHPPRCTGAWSRPTPIMLACKEIRSGSARPRRRARFREDRRRHEQTGDDDDRRKRVQHDLAHHDLRPDMPSARQAWTYSRSRWDIIRPARGGRPAAMRRRRSQP